MIHIQRRTTPAWRLPMARSELRDMLQRILDGLGLGHMDLELSLANDRDMARYNEHYLDCLGPTNILSFVENNETDTTGEDSGNLGVLILGVETLWRECLLYGQEPREHAARLLCHGVLHLAGYDHGPEMDDLTDVLMNQALMDPYPEAAIQG